MDLVVKPSFLVVSFTFPGLQDPPPPQNVRIEASTLESGLEKAGLSMCDLLHGEHKGSSAQSLARDQHRPHTIDYRI